MSGRKRSGTYWQTSILLPKTIKDSLSNNKRKNFPNQADFERENNEIKDKKYVGNKLMGEQQAASGI